MTPLENIRAWLETEGRMETDRTKFVDSLARRLLDAGVDLGRMTTAVPIMHPLVDTSMVLWNRDGELLERTWRMLPEHYAMRAASPLHLAYFEQRASNCSIGPTPEDGEFGILADLRAEGFTHYLCLPAPFSDGTTKAVTFATRHPHGFKDSDIAILEGIMPSLAMVLETQTLKRTARTLLHTYLGETTGEQVLTGSVKRGDGRTIPSVIWFSDMRGSTALADRLPLDEFLDLLNQVFDCTAQSVLDHGGEVLRFIGDAVLAIFPIQSPDQTADACTTAVSAARAAIDRLDQVNAERSGRGEDIIEFGIGLHIGEIMYGNIGTPERLEFGITGSAANEAARVEGQCKELGQRLLVSGAVAQHLTGEWRSLGKLELKGVAKPMELFSV